MKIDREFHFKGDRKYLESASLFDDIIHFRGPETTRIDFKFHRKTGNQVAYTETKPQDEHELIAEWTDTQGRLYIVERDAQIENATPYDEPTLVSKLALDLEHRLIRIPTNVAPFSRIESLVAAFKFLLQSVYPDIKRKYVFVRTRMRFLPETAMKIQYTRDIGAFFQGDIYADDEYVGQIFFGEWQ